MTHLVYKSEFQQLGFWGSDGVSVGRGLLTQSQKASLLTSDLAKYDPHAKRVRALFPPFRQLARLYTGDFDSRAFQWYNVQVFTLYIPSTRQKFTMIDAQVLAQIMAKATRVYGSEYEITHHTMTVSWDHWYEVPKNFALNGVTHGMPIVHNSLQDRYYANVYQPAIQAVQGHIPLIFTPPTLSQWISYRKQQIMKEMRNAN